MIECYCDRCSGFGPRCYEGGEHEVEANGFCADCGKFFWWGLYEAKMAKAVKEGRHCDDHFHKTVAGKQACTTPERYPYVEGEEIDEAG